MEPSHEIIDRVAGWIVRAKRGLAFTGAGISTESGIPDFRSPGGVWAKYQPVYFDEFMARPEARHEYWRQKSESHREFADSRPNRGHEILARWEGAGYLRGVITQNIDELHQLAGSREVLELHGTARKVACMDCAARFEAEPWIDRFLRTDTVPVCPECGGRLKHATVSFGQMLPEDVLETAIEWSCQADLMLAMGSSLVVTPAADLPRLAKRHGAKLVIINRDPTGQDTTADAVIHAPIGATLEAIDRAVRKQAES